MLRLLVLGLILAMVGPSSATWCVCKDGMGDAVLQKTLDYACGAGADCNPVHPNGICYNPNTVKAHCSYAVNSYFQRKGQAQGSCDFAGTAMIAPSDPSSSGCPYPASASSTTPTTTSPGSTRPGSSTPIGGSPFPTSPTGVLGPSVNTDMSHGGVLLQRTSFAAFTALVFSGLMF